MPLAFNLGLLFYAWLVLLVLQFAIAPLLVRLLPKLTDCGWVFGRLVGWLAISLIIWNVSHLDFPLNQQIGVWVSFLGVVFIASLINFHHRTEFKTWFKKNWSLVLIEEILFFASLVGFGLIRSFNPNMLDLEKFMDGGFIASYLRSPTLPMGDVWLSGFTVNYYTFGHFMGAVMTRLWGFDLAYSYNLLLALIFALTLTGGFSLALNLIIYGQPKLRLPGILGGLLGGILLVFGGNSHTLWFWLKNQTLDGYWYANATRFIEYTIHEFPAYSFIVSDLHGHVWGLPIVLLFLTLSIAWYKSMIEPGTSHRLTASLGVLLGIMIMTNTWDVMVYGFLLAGLFLILLVTEVRLTKLVFAGVWLSGWMIATSLFWFINFESISQGVRLVGERSPLWQLAVLWGGHVSFGFLALGLVWQISRKTHPKIKLVQPVVLIMVMTAFFFLLLPELIYFKDIYPSHPRANTMFKFTYQAFILLTLVAAWVTTKLWQFYRSRLWPIRIALGVLCLIVIGGFLIFPYSGYDSYYQKFAKMNYLDGTTWTQASLPDDYQAILWLKENIKGHPVILEAVGESYTTFARVSANTGLPTVLGWRVHEWLWRNSFDEPARRTEQVRTVYERPLSEEAAQVLAEHQIRYIILGGKEREAYRVDERGLVNLGQIVFESGTTKVISL